MAVKSWGWVELELDGSVFGAKVDVDISGQWDIGDIDIGSWDGDWGEARLCGAGWGSRWRLVSADMYYQKPGPG